MPSYGNILAFAKEVPTDDFFRGQSLKNLRDQKEVQKEQDKQKYQEELFKMVKPSNVKLLPSFQKKFYDSGS